MAPDARVKLWWKQAIVYQIYPASFSDSNGDGIGDLPGVISKLDYIKGLGVDVIWICPMYDSPQVDMGYDISNYEDVYRPYGTLADMDELIRESHARGIRVMLDLVINHTSDMHAWFKESRSSKDNAKRDWYMWQPPKYSASGEHLPPNNWRSLFGGGSAWTWDEQTGEYYLHLFTKEQPDLNWENEVTRKAIYESAMEFWLKRGVDGFRIDTVNLYSKLPGLPDAPIQDPESFYQSPVMLVCNGPRMHEFLSEMNAVLAKYGAITVGELGATPEQEKVLKYVSAEAKQLDMVFQFDMVMLGYGTNHMYDAKPRNFGLPQFKVALEAIQTLIRGNDAWTTVFLENHDQARSVSRFADDSPRFRVASAKLLALMQACLSGTQYIYQGQEIGLVNAPRESYPVENYVDVNSRLFIDAMKDRYGAGNAAELDRAADALQYFARDHGRIPIPWSAKGLYGGFSAAAEVQAGKIVNEPWMKTHPLASEINVEAQLDDPDSVLSFWKQMTAFRRDHTDLLVYSDFYGLRMDDKDTLLFYKEQLSGSSSKDKALVMLNFSTKDATVVAPDAQELGFASGTALQFKLIASTHGDKNKRLEDALAPLEGRVYLVTA